MNHGMIRGIDMRVEMASEENGFVELPEEAADQPWAKIGEGTAKPIVFTDFLSPSLISQFSCWIASNR